VDARRWRSALAGERHVVSGMGHSMRLLGVATLASGILATLALQSCEDDMQPPVEHLPFAGILAFDEICTPAGGDTSDFLPRPSGANYSLVAACPNPAVRASTRIVFNIPQPDSVWLLIYDRTNSPPIDTLYASRALPGSHRILWSRPGTVGILRVEMDTASGFHSYGDVEFTP